MEEPPKGAVSPKVEITSPNGKKYFILGKQSKSVLAEFDNLSDYINYCSKLTSIALRYCEFHPDPFKH